MRWDDLFDDLEAQLAAAEREEVLAEVAERTRAERAQVGWFDRVVAALGETVTCATAAGPVQGRITDHGKDWLVIEESGRGSAIVPAAAVVSIGGLGRRSQAGVTPRRRFGLGVALRAVSRDRSPVAVHDVGGGLWAGTIDFVGSDHLEVLLHPADALPRAGVVTGRRVVPWSSIAVIRRIG